MNMFHRTGASRIRRLRLRSSAITPLELLLNVDRQLTYFAELLGDRGNCFGAESTTIGWQGWIRETRSPLWL